MAHIAPATPSWQHRQDRNSISLKNNRTGRQSAHRRRDDFVVAIERVLADHGITDFEYGKRNNGHRSIEIRHCGQQRLVIFAFSSRNRNGPRNAAGNVRRAIRSMEAAGDGRPL